LNYKRIFENCYVKECQQRSTEVSHTGVMTYCHFTVMVQLCESCYLNIYCLFKVYLMTLTVASNDNLAND